uniref:Uncharacterized protein n=1 Tax=Tanacetum cinerariifolium TaxID=118510 RepID=A0A6L2P857_TANCI|nr:hypothetical protein [Tanacetum cinerariifolium]
MISTQKSKTLDNNTQNLGSKIGKTKLTEAYFEGQVYEVVKAFYPDVVHLQFLMEECHNMLTDQIDWLIQKQGKRTGLVDFQDESFSLS